MTKLEKNCIQCGGVFLSPLKEINRGRGLYCCLRCANIARVACRKNPNARAESYQRRKAHPMHAKATQARHLVEEAVLRGRLVPLPCESCGAERTDGHHPDYDQPLSVIWLCRSCHMKIHKAVERPAASTKR